VVRQFTPNWFAATMGTGILAIALAQFQTSVPALHIVAEGLWMFNIGLFALFSCLYAARWIFFFDGARRIFGHWLLPVVAAEVAAVSGGLLAPHLADAHAQLVMLTLSYVLWALSVPVAMSILVVLLLRMALQNLPHANMAASSWLALGPIGTGALGLMTLGGAAPAILAANGLERFGAFAEGLGLFGGLLLWGYGLWWFALALIVTLRYLRDGLPFNIGWWATPSLSASTPSRR
jgi:tellurite resistance protein TehA-like permease